MKLSAAVNEEHTFAKDPFGMLFGRDTCCIKALREDVGRLLFVLEIASLNLFSGVFHPKLTCKSQLSGLAGGWLLLRK